jgi:phosphohistidine swiveling domain-containing protein
MSDATPPAAPRPPPAALSSESVAGLGPNLWDNSELAESFEGVTTPLTFSFAAHAYQQIFRQFCLTMGVPPKFLARRLAMFDGMLGLVRGRIYCNVVNWHRIAHMLPWFDTSPAQVLTLLGAQQMRQGHKLRHFGPDAQANLAGLFDVAFARPHYSAVDRIRLGAAGLWRFLRVDKIVADFQHHFDTIFSWASRLEFRRRSLPEQLAAYRYLDKQLLRQWSAPIINDACYFAAFGRLKKLSVQWLQLSENEAVALQNDLLCGQGDLQSMEPTRLLCRIAQWVDEEAPKTRAWLLSTPTAELVASRRQWPDHAAGFSQRFDGYLALFGFACADELKLEAVDLHTDPTFAVQAIVRFLRMGPTTVDVAMRANATVAQAARRRVVAQLGPVRRIIFFRWVASLGKMLRHREHLRFLRTQVVGVVRQLFLAMGENLVALEALGARNDIFYLTCDEIFAYIEGRALSHDLKPLVAQRRSTFATYAQTPAPPQRFVTYGTATASMAWPHILAAGDIAAVEAEDTDDASAMCLWGTPCASGIVEGKVRVVRHQDEAQALADEILVTARIDPAWIPLYPACRGLLLGQGTLLSHASAVARELGLPTIVAVGDRLLERLQTGMRVRMNGTTGEINILPAGEVSADPVDVPRFRQEAHGQTPSQYGP